jgi:tetratricopeptide (TPR) repeat protein
MAQPGINAKIEELQFRIKTDPKSRLFFPLAEELRKNGRLPEAEQVLRTGLGVHTTYLSAWVSLGRVLREQQKHSDAVEALNTALQVDPGNVVAARLLADSYLDLGEKVEAIKKYKLVHALMPGDEELEAKIQQLDRELAPPEPEPVAAPLAPETPPVESETAPESPFDETARTEPEPSGTDDEVPMAAQHAESPFEEPSGYTAAALEIEQPEGMHIEEAPLVAEVPTVWTDEPAADVFAPAETEPAPDTSDVAATTTMADLYARQGLTDDARKIYGQILEHDPSNDDARSKLDALSGTAEEAAQQASSTETAFDDAPPQPGNPATLHRDAKVRALQQWMEKVSRRESADA